MLVFVLQEARYIGIDKSESQLNMARENIKFVKTDNIELIHGNCTGMLKRSFFTSNAKTLRWLTLILSVFFVVKMLSAYWVCCICSNSRLKTFTVESNTMDSDQTASNNQST